MKTRSHTLLTRPGVFLVPSWCLTYSTFSLLICWVRGRKNQYGLNPLSNKVALLGPAHWSSSYLSLTLVVWDAHTLASQCYQGPCPLVLQEHAHAAPSICNKFSCPYLVLQISAQGSLLQGNFPWLSPLWTECLYPSLQNCWSPELSCDG